MRVFCTALIHETNSFSPVPTNRASYEATILIRPGDRRLQRPMSVMGIDTIIADAKAAACDVTISTVAVAQPAAPTVRRDYEALRDEIVADLASMVDEGPCDMAFFILHGAMMAEGYDDCEGDLLAAARTVVGPDCAIGVLLDLHCNITDQMLANADILMACREYPHTDFDHRAAELFDHIHTVAQGSAVPVTSQYRIPMLSMFHTPREPMRGFVDRVQSFEGKDNVMQITLAHGFPWSDFPEAGSSVIVTTNDDPKLAAELAEQVGREFFELREQGTAPMLSIDEALDAATNALRKEPEGTVVMSDGSDNAGGGAASDSTFLLAACLERGLTDVAIGLLWDPVAVELAFAAGVGAKLDMRIGGKVGPLSGDPLDLYVEVLELTEDKRQQLWTETQLSKLGRTALIETNGIQIVLNDRRQQPMHPMAFTEAGCDPWTKRLVIVKSSQHFYANFEPHAIEVIYCDAPGSLNGDVHQRPYRRITRPVWPLDEIAL